MRAVQRGGSQLAPRQRHCGQKRPQGTMSGRQPAKLASCREIGSDFSPDGADTSSLWDDAKQHWNKMLKVVAGDWLKPE